MTRKLRFRAWNIPNKTMYMDIQKGMLCQNEKGQLVLGVTFETICKDADSIVMQLWRTWNGIDLFDGDIVKISGILRVIRYDIENECFCFANVSDLIYEKQWEINQNPKMEWWQKYANDIEVIGNIYENAELLAL